MYTLDPSAVVGSSNVPSRKVSHIITYVSANITKWGFWDALAEQEKNQLRIFAIILQSFRRHPMASRDSGSYSSCSRTTSLVQMQHLEIMRWVEDWEQ